MEIEQEGGNRAQGENRAALPKQLKQVFRRYPNVFQKSGITDEEINISIMKNS